MEVSDQTLVILGVEMPSLETFTLTLEHCLGPTLSQILNQILSLLICTFGFRALSKRTRTLPVFHFFSIAFGVFMLTYVIFDFYTMICYVVLVLCSYKFLILISSIKQHLFPNYEYYGIIILITMSTLMIVAEFVFPDEEAWFRLRGPAMILCMKTISFGCSFFDEIPNILGFLGYIFFPGNIIFGPWISFDDYNNMYTYRFEKSPIPIFTALKLVLHSCTMLLVSSCLLPFLNWDPIYDAWLNAYVSALSFRMSHYFIMGLSELTFYTSKPDLETNYISFSYPSEIELPYSMLLVVINWNIPIHKFLKEYVFKESLRCMGKFWAIIATYIYSSMLHGINVEVAVVLFHLSIFSYLEMNMREFLASRFNACVRAKHCSVGCRHKYHTFTGITIFINCCFSLLTAIQLIYTGCLMDNRNENASISERLWDIHYKWINLGYLCHYIALIFFVLTL